jgi:predicted TIM-barrel fold metal-dependent hydrolase
MSDNEQGENERGLKSCDSHFLEPEKFYYERLPASKRSVAPRLIEIDGVLHWTDTFSMVPVETSIACFQDVENVSFRGGVGKWREVSDLQLRKGYHDHDYLLSEILLPDGGLLWRIRDYQTKLMCFDIYNEYSSEVEKKYEGVFYMPKVIPTASPSVALEYAEKAIDCRSSTNSVVVDLGFVSSAITDSEYSRFFEVLNEASIILILHANGFSTTHQFRYPYSAKTTMFCVNAMNFLIDSYMRSFFDKYDQIKVYFSEVGYKWIDHILDKVPFYCDRYCSLEKITPIQKPIDQVVADSVFFGFTNDLPCDYYLRKLARNLLFGSDFPHADSSYGSSRQHFNSTSDISMEYAERVFRRNAEDLFGI